MDNLFEVNAIKCLGWLPGGGLFDFEYSRGGLIEGRAYSLIQITRNTSCCTAILALDTGEIFSM